MGGFIDLASGSSGKGDFIDLAGMNQHHGSYHEVAPHVPVQPGPLVTFVEQFACFQLWASAAEVAGGYGGLGHYHLRLVVLCRS